MKNDRRKPIYKERQEKGNIQRTTEERQYIKNDRRKAIYKE